MNDSQLAKIRKDIAISAGLTKEEEMAFERGDFRIEKSKRKFLRYLGFLPMIPLTINVLFSKRIENCELTFGLISSYWQDLSWWFSVLVTIGYFAFQYYQDYVKAKNSGFIPLYKRQHTKYHFYTRSNLSNIHQLFFRKFAMLVACLLVAIIFFTAMSRLDKYKVDYGNQSLFSLKTYQVASKKLQQQCLANKTTP